MPSPLGDPLCAGRAPAHSWDDGKKPNEKRKKTDHPREGWEDGTPPPHRDFKERGVMR